jgi:hypothetical protein
MTNNLASQALCVFALASEAQSNDVANSLPLPVRPAGVITPTTHHRLPSSKPSRHFLSVSLVSSHAWLVLFLSQTRELRQSKKHE